MFNITSFCTYATETSLFTCWGVKDNSFGNHNQWRFETPEFRSTEHNNIINNKS